VFVDSPPNSHYDVLRHPPLSYSYSVPVTNTDLNYRTSRHIRPHGRPSRLPFDVRKRQQPLPPIPQDSDHRQPGSRWVEMHGTRETGQSRWYYRVEQTLATAGSESDLLVEREEESHSTYKTPRKTFLTPPHVAGSPAGSATGVRYQDQRIPASARTMTARHGEMVAPPPPRQRSFSLEPTAYASRAQPPRRQKYVGSGTRRRCETYKRSASAEPTSDITRPGNRKGEEHHNRRV